MKLKQTKVATLAATLITFGSLVGGAKGAVTINIWEDGADVRAQASGTLDIIGLSFLSNSPFPDDFRIDPTDPEILFFGPGDVYSGLGFSLTFGTGGFNATGTTSGDHFGFESNNLLVPTGFVSGGSIFSEGVFSGTDLATLGVNVGTFDYTLPNTDTISVVIGSAPSPAAVPEPSSALLLGLGLLGFVSHRKRAS
ncbi:hypothetical protein NT6N_27740 [Oceaniferula spumae]|uniref:Ice-binding protein C-terminal domain-containing protein n=1 Tax=Oceaniferula spumae TaxID=2979115 RepID=A0AAT9FP16_9BACT